MTVHCPTCRSEVDMVESRFHFEPAIRGHDLVPFPARGKFGEVRMVYCRRCGATQAVEAGDRPPLGVCVVLVAEPLPGTEVPRP